MFDRRPTAVLLQKEAAGILHKAGLIEYSRGHVTIQNRESLEDVACECYPIIREEYVRLGLL
jgi:hypothetical protein